MKKIGGGTSKNHIYNVLRNIFSYDCAAACSWSGKNNNKFRVMDLRTIQVMRGNIKNL